MSACALEVRDLAVRYPQHSALERASFQLEHGAIACLAGPSGSGKTTLLHAIAGFTAIARGEILIHGESVSTPARTVTPESRGAGVVFQDFALFPHLSAAGNITAAMQSRPAGRRAESAIRYLAQMDLAEFADSFPQQMSGGQQARLALARALAAEPRLLLLDEPFANLDRELRLAGVARLRETVKSRGIACLLVTHDLGDALALGDQVGILEHGRIVQWGAPGDLHQSPAHPATVRLLGHGALLHGTAHTRGLARTALGDLALSNGVAIRPGQPLAVWVRPEQLSTDNAPPGNAGVLRVTDNGVERQVRLQLDSGEQVVAHYTPGNAPRPGERRTVRARGEIFTAFAAG
ncbi:MAG: ABC transporter ATP-binding protein [Gammaproteobacteria bacterium]|nr:ABC transporter ATP-binding protein [Gammaproteobacteria bacterium]